MQKRRGFTTVELVIVIAVIAILATALIPTFGGLIKSANHTADVQTAKNLTTLILSYSMDHKIESEQDLVNAINEGMGDDKYYQNLKAKNAKYGSCFWYDYDSYTIEVGTIEEMANKHALANPNFSDWDITLANGFAGGSSFDTANIRTMIVSGYMLMGCDTDSDLIKLILALETADESTYNAALSFRRL